MKSIRTKDFNGCYRDIEVSDEFYQEWMLLQNETQRIWKKEYYHRNATPLEELSLTREVSFEEADCLLDDLIRREEQMRLHQAIHRLTPTQQRRIRMYMDGLSYAEIARREGQCISVIYRSLQGAYQKLRAFLTDW